MATPLSQEEFGHLLEAYAFNDISDSDRQRLLEAILESDDRSLDFARVQELRDQFTDPVFRRELLDVLGEPTRGAWWRQLWRPQILVPLTGSVIAIAAVSLFSVRDAPMQPPLPLPPRVATHPTSTQPAVQSSPPSLEAPRKLSRSVPAKVNENKPETALARGRQKESSTPQTGAPETKAPGEGPSVAHDPPPRGGGMFGGLTANVNRGLVKRATSAAFDRPGSAASDLNISLPFGNRYSPTNTVTVRVNLSRAARLYAAVRAPSGAIRHVYPDAGPLAPLLPPGAQVFWFPVSSLDAATEHGVSTLRVFVVFEGEGPREIHWRWIAQSARFAETKYSVVARD
jgi:hypothetical protein